MGQLFQSFWWGEPLSPYEWLSLKSFVDFGHDFDLYTFDPHIAVPAQVRVRNAEELAGRDEFFVYQDGFGKGSPAAFANVFRYRLLAERGGWWVDTDVVCLTDAIPAYSRFVARQDGDLVNNAVMRFEPRDPVIVRCLERAVEKGRSIRWGEIGPQLLTQVLGELGQTERIFDSSVCYPIHYNDALALLHPSQSERVADRLAGSQLLHLWNGMLANAGVRKSYLPPRGSVLRRLVEQHQVDGWTGEYDEAGLSEATDINARLKAEAVRRNELETALREADARLRAEVGARGALEETLRAVAGQRTELETALRAVDARLQAEARRRTELETALGECVAAGDRLRAERDALLGSTSWRLTAPLRALRRGLSR
jgi:Alpha 1,4-glycosyltransferase conserved region